MQARCFMTVVPGATLPLTSDMHRRATVHPAVRDPGEGAPRSCSISAPSGRPDVRGWYARRRLRSHSGVSANRFRAACVESISVEK